MALLTSIMDVAVSRRNISAMTMNIVTDALDLRLGSLSKWWH